MFYKNEEVKEIIEEKIYMGEEENDMMLPDLIPGALRILKEEAIEEGREEGLKRGKKEGLKQGRRELLIKILTKKFSVIPSDEIVELIEKSSINKIAKIEDKIFELENWEEVKELIK